MRAFENKVVWITGASSGIGEALCYALAKQGAKLVLSARRKELLEQLAQKLPGTPCLILPFDLAVEQDYAHFVALVVAHYGSIDVLLNNGGISQRAYAADTSEETSRKLFQVNYFANTALSKACLPVFKKQGGGKIVVISSIAGKFGYFLRSSYSATKHALKGYYESLRFEEKANGIEVFLIYPGRIKTPISLSALDAEGKKHGVMDKGQLEGMPVETCASKILKAITRKKYNITIGGKELLALFLYNYLPKLFFSLMYKRGAD